MMCYSFVEDDVVNLEGVQFAGFSLKAGSPVINHLSHHVINHLSHHWVVVFTVWDRLAAGLEEDLMTR